VSGVKDEEVAMTEDRDTVLVRLLRQLTVETDRFAEMFGEAHGMHRTDLNALVVIMHAAHRGESVSPGQLARALDMSASAITAVLDRLEHAGHVARDRSPRDRRRIELLMPEEAMRLGQQFFGPLGVELSSAWSGFNEDERATIARFLTLSIEATARTRAKLTGDQ
jgi:DNA-binding MarR family transcriptional regulator